jgi:hypothetical protein
MFFKRLFLKLKNCALCKSKLNCTSSCCIEEKDEAPVIAPVITITGNGSPVINIRTIRDHSPQRHDARGSFHNHDDDDDEEEE